MSDQVLYIFRVATHASKPIDPLTSTSIRWLGCTFYGRRWGGALSHDTYPDIDQVLGQLQQDDLIEQVNGIQGMQHWRLTAEGCARGNSVSNAHNCIR